MKAASLVLIGHLTITAYVPAQPYGAMGEYYPVRPGKTCAVSQDLRHLLGKEIHIDGHGWAYVNDVMPRQWRRKVDLAVDSTEDAKGHGRRDRVPVKVAK